MAKYCVLIVFTFLMTSACALGVVDFKPPQTRSAFSSTDRNELIRALAELEVFRERQPFYAGINPESMRFETQKRAFRFVGSRGKKSTNILKRFSYLPSRGRRSVL